MTKNLDNVFAGGGATSEVFVAPKGTTMPVGIAAPSVTFKGLGWLSEEGVNLAREADRQVIRGHQGGAIVKRLTASVDDSFKFQCLELTALTLGLLFRGQEPVIASSVATTLVTNQTASDERAFIIHEVLDTGVIERFLIPVGDAELTAEIGWTTTGLRIMEFTVGVLGDYSHVTDAPAVIA